MHLEASNDILRYRLYALYVLVSTHLVRPTSAAATFQHLLRRSDDAD
jgi:hypothetical protein